MRSRPRAAHQSEENDSQEEADDALGKDADGVGPPVLHGVQNLPAGWRHTSGREPPPAFWCCPYR
eukprot:scaffold240_cov243-Pinguiococcus_pyrenoidosus.AAC.2